jgi:hypothetical protein
MAISGRITPNPGRQSATRTGGRRDRAKVARIASIMKINFQCLQTLEEGSAISAPAAMPRSGIAAEADAADIDLKPAWIDIRDIAAQPC